MPNPVYDYSNHVKDVPARTAYEELEKMQAADNTKVYRIGQPYNDCSNDVGIFADPKPGEAITPPVKKTAVRKPAAKKTATKKTSTKR